MHQTKPFCFGVPKGKGNAVGGKENQSNTLILNVVCLEHTRCNMQNPFVLGVPQGKGNQEERQIKGPQLFSMKIALAANGNTII